MLRLWLALGVASAFALAVTGTIGGAPPIFNATDHPINALLDPEEGINCGNGNATWIHR